MWPTASPFRPSTWPSSGCPPSRAATGIAAAGLVRSHHFGVVGRHVERLAEVGLVALAFGNTPKAIAPWGGKRALFGTSPLAFAAPQRKCAACCRRHGAESGGARQDPDRRAKGRAHPRRLGRRRGRQADHRSRPPRSKARCSRSAAPRVRHWR
jgi:hypothetical protein